MYTELPPLVFVRREPHHIRGLCLAAAPAAVCQQAKSVKHSDQPKPKRRRVANKEDLIDS